MAGLLLTLAACSSPGGGSREARRENMAPPQEPLIGEQTYFDGAVFAAIKLGPFRRPMVERNSSDSSGGGERPSGGFGGGPPPGRGFGGGGGNGGGRPMGGGMSRQVLTATFTNRSPAELTLNVIMIKSILGNFIPEPETATLAPGASITLEPMRGSLTNLSALQVTLELERGEDRESHELELQPDPAFAPAGS